MDYTEATALLGKEISDEGVKAFLDKYGIKYPKKDTISAASNKWSFGLGTEKTGMELSFNIDVKNQKYEAKQAQRKDIFKPVLASIRYTKNTPFTLPFQLTFSSTLDELKQKFGEPVFNDAFGPVYRWKVMLDKDRDIICDLEYDIDGERLWEIWIKIKEIKELFRLYWTQYGETIESALKQSYVYDEEERQNSKQVSRIVNKAVGVIMLKRQLFFILWAIDNGYFSPGDAFAGDIKKVREGKMDIAEFAAKAFKDSPFVSPDHFINIDRDFVDSYYTNIYDRKLSPPGWYYGKDFDSAFSQKEYELEIADDLSKLQFSAENRRQVSEFVNKRYVEFQKLKKAKK